MLARRWAVGWLCLLCLAGAPAAVRAQDAGAAGDKPELVLNLGEKVNLKTLTDFVAAQLDLNIIYDDELLNSFVTLKTPKAIPADSLRPLWESLLKIKGFVVVEQPGVPGMLRVTKAAALDLVTGKPLDVDQQVPQGGATAVVSKMYKLENVGPERVKKMLEKFMSQGSSLIELPDYDMIIITDYVSNFDRLEYLLSFADQAGRAVVTRFVSVEHMDAGKMLTQVRDMLAAQAKVRGDAKDSERYALVADERTNQIAIAATPDEVLSIAELIASLDKSLDLETVVYRLNVAEPKHVDEVARELIGEDKAKRLYNSVAHEDSGLLAVTATASIHEQVKALIATMDTPVPEAQSPIRFYKLQNADALGVAETLSGIGGDEGLGAVSIDGISAVPPVGFENTPPPTPVDPAGNAAPPTSAPGGVGGSGAPAPDVRIYAYEPQNMVIVVAPPAMQPIYEKLIKRLDARRPQVLVEATVVALDTTDEFSLGVEISRSDSADGGTLLNFSQFGLSTVDASTGALTLKPGLGFNGALLDADIAEIIIQALQKDTRSSVLTRPSVLVNDNAEGKLESKDTEPFESVNAGQTVSTTSYGGDLEAGTKIIVKPSISDGDFLKLSYEVEVSSFVGERTETSTGGTLPPARTENKVKSEVTIPDGHTIVVGGLTREIDNETISAVPILGKIPILKYAFSQRSTNKRQITIFVFLRPVILRDDKFEDLKVLSGSAAGRAQLPSSFPTSLPVEIR